MSEKDPQEIIDYNNENEEKKIDFIKKYNLKKSYDKNALIKYSKVIIKEYREYIIRKRKELGLIPNQSRLIECLPIKKQDSANIEQLATRKGRFKLFWYGLVYKITINNAKNPKKKYYGGKTTSTLAERWHRNVLNAITKPNTWHYPLIKRIRKYLFADLNLTKNDLKNKNRWHWQKIHAILNKNFKREVYVICFNHTSLRKEERKFIQENNLIDKGLNILEGGEGGHIYELPMLLIARCICLGYDMSKIYRFLEKKCNINCTFETVRQRVIDFWGSYENAQIVFLRPMLAILIKLRYKLYEINKMFKRFMLERIQLFFGGKSYRDLIKNSDQDFSELKVKKPLPLWTRTGKPKVFIPIKYLVYLICRYLYAIEAVKDPKVNSLLSIYSSPRQVIVYQIQQQFEFKDWNEARKYLMIPNLIKNLRNNEISPKDIYISIGYKPRSAKTHDTISRTIFFGLKTSEVKKFLKKHPQIETYKDFKSTFSTETINRTILSKSKIDELLFKYLRSTNMIKELNGWFTGDFLNEVQKYYPNFKEAKWIVKAPYVIENLRKSPNNYSKSEIIKIFKTIGYNQYSAKNYNCVIRDMFFGMSIKECICFFKTHLNIHTYQQAKDVFLSITDLDKIPKSRKKGEISLKNFVKKETLEKYQITSLKKKVFNFLEEEKRTLQETYQKFNTCQKSTIKRYYYKWIAEN